MKTVFENWKFQCPQCRRDDAITVIGMCTLLFTGQGTVADGGHTWDDHSEFTCGHCGFHSQGYDFKSKPPEHAVDYCLTERQRKVVKHALCLQRLPSASRYADEPGYKETLETLIERFSQP